MSLGSANCSMILGISKRLEQVNQPSLQIYGRGDSYSNRTCHSMPKYNFIVEGVRAGQRKA
jgi:hypothetical protein